MCCSSHVEDPTGPMLYMYLTKNKVSMSMPLSMFIILRIFFLIEIIKEKESIDDKLVSKVPIMQRVASISTSSNFLTRSLICLKVEKIGHFECSGELSEW